MAAKPETTFYRSVHKHLPKEPTLYQMKLYNPFLAGPPDHWYSGDKADLWTEWKYLKPPKRPSTSVAPGLSGPQQRWLRERYEQGRNVAVVLGCPDGGVVYRDLDWEKPMPYGEYRERLQTRTQLADWIKGQVCH